MALTALALLYIALATKPQKEERITREESSPIAQCYLKAFGILGFAFYGAGGLGWQAAKMLKMPIGFGRFVVAAGAASASYTVAFNWVNSTIAVSCVDHILTQDATRMQRELLNILVTNNGYGSWRQLMSKHFYPEALYNDEGDEKQIRWRKRSTFTEIASSYDDGNEAKPQRTHTALPNPRNRSISNGSDDSKTKPMLQNSSGNSDVEVEEDGLDIVFGSSETTENTASPVNSKAPGKMLTRKQKRLQLKNH